MKKLTRSGIQTTPKHITQFIECREKCSWLCGGMFGNPAFQGNNMDLYIW